MDGIWLKNLAGAKALVADVAERDRWAPHGWAVTTAPAETDMVWTRNPDVQDPGLIPWSAREYWLGRGWEPAAPPEPVDPTRDPVLSDTADELVPPPGTVAEVAEWVGGDPVRAEAALAAEHRRDAPRTTLVDQLQRVGQGDASSETAAEAAPNKEA